MPAIRVLDENTCGQIAAGEVVERPVSVVKELVENSLDAGATRIEVDVAAGGLDITVTDDGCGMSAADAALAFARHATSKISRADDLLRVSTMGFRGEALPSIAAVSRVELCTRRPGEDAATRVVVREGRVSESGPAAGAPGTRVWVSDLFANVPVRLKHLKSEPFEFGLIQELVGRLAMARSGVTFALRLKGREVFFAAGGLMETAVAVYGRETVRQMFPFAGEGEGVSFHGLAGHPGVARSSRRYQAVFVNGRWVRNWALTRAVEDAYRNLLVTGKYPLAVLDLTLDPALLDVNVHPAKQDVRLLDEPLIAGLVREGVRQALARHSLVPVWPGSPGGPKAQPLSFSLAPAEPAIEISPHENLVRAGSPEPVLREEAPPYEPPAPWPAMEVLVWLAPTYILAQSIPAGGLYIIDQHAAHERVLYEKHLARLEGGRASQILALPLPLELDPGQKAVLERNLSLLTDLGFAVEPFGGAYLLRAAPLVTEGEPAEGVLVDLLDALLEKGRLERRQVVERLAAMRACKDAVKSGQRLDPPEMAALLTQLAAAASPYTCPHGRPTVIEIGERELLHRFKRIP